MHIQKITLATVALATFASAPSLAQEEEFRYVTKSAGKAFYAKGNRYVEWTTGHQIYDIEVNGGSLSGAGNITHYLSGVSLQKPSGSTKETWLFGPASLTKIRDHIELNDARVLDLELVAEYGLPAAGGGPGPDYYAVLTRNRGAEGKGWHWWWNVTESELRAGLQETNSRLIDIEIVQGFIEEGNARYVAVAISNTGSDYRQYKFESGLTESQVQAFLANNPAYRARHIGYEGGGAQITWNVIIERTTEVSSTEVVFGYTKSGLASYANTNNKRIASLAFSRFDSRYAAILVPTRTLFIPGPGGWPF